MEKTLNILMVARANLFAQPGGDTYQVEQTMRHLERRGHSVALHLNRTRVDDAPYDVVHHFNLGRPEDHLNLLKRWKKPAVLSTNWVDYSEYESAQNLAFPHSLLQGLQPGARERVKAIGRNLAAGKLPPMSLLKHSHTAALRKTLQRVAATLTTTAREAERIADKVAPMKNNHIVPLGVDHNVFFDAQKPRKGIVMAGRIEGVKNQLTALNALKRHAWPVTVIGKASANHRAYYARCQAAGRGFAEFTPHLRQDELAHAFQTAAVVLIPSWFETFGLVAAEAGFSGARVVMTNRSDAFPDWKNRVWACDPSSEASIEEAVYKALHAPETPSWADLRTTLSWEAVAEATERVYLSVIP